MRTAVVIATTEGPVAVTLFAHDPALSQGSMIAVRDGDDAGIQRLGQFAPFVDRRARRVLEGYGLPPLPGPMIMEVEADIETGTSWQLGTLVTMLLYARGLFEADPANAERVLYCTGEVANSSGLIKPVEAVERKLALSRQRIRSDAQPAIWLFPQDNDAGADADGDRQLTLAPVATLDDVVRLVLPDPPVARPALPAGRRPPLIAACALLLLAGAATAAYLRWAPPPADPPTASDDAPIEPVEGSVPDGTAVAGSDPATGDEPIEVSGAPTPPAAVELAELTIEQRLVPGDPTRLGGSCTALNFTRQEPARAPLRSIAIVAAANGDDELAPLPGTPRLCGLDFSLRLSESGGSAALPLYALLRIAISPAGAADILQQGAADGLTPVGGPLRLSLLPRPRRDLRYRLLAVVGPAPVPSDAARLLAADDPALSAALRADGFAVHLLSQRLARDNP